MTSASASKSENRVAERRAVKAIVRLGQGSAIGRVRNDGLAVKPLLTAISGTKPMPRPDSIIYFENGSR